MERVREVVRASMVVAVTKVDLTDVGTIVVNVDVIVVDGVSVRVRVFTMVAVEEDVVVTGEVTVVTSELEMV